MKLHALAKSRARTEFSFETFSCELTLISLFSNFNVLYSCNGEFPPFSLRGNRNYPITFLNFLRNFGKTRKCRHSVDDLQPLHMQ